MDPYTLDTIVCPRCHQDLPVASEICGHCGADTRGTTAVESERENDESSSLLHRPWVVLVIVLHLGFLGIPVYWRLKYSLAERIWICVASIVYTVLAVALIWWGVLRIWAAIQAVS